MPLFPLLLHCGYHLTPVQRHSYQVIGFTNLVVRQNYWVWDDKNLRGTILDFFVQVEKRPFWDVVDSLACLIGIFDTD